VIAVSCGIKISAVQHLVLLQYTRLTDRRTDRRNSDSNTVRYAARQKSNAAKNSRRQLYVFYFFLVFCLMTDTVTWINRT